MHIAGRHFAAMAIVAGGLLLSAPLATAQGMQGMGQQDPQKMPSPPATATVKLDGQMLTVKYNQPHMRGRTIMGGLVPYGKVWRTGANPATTFITPVHLKIGQLDVPAGTYTLYTLPSQQDAWMLIVNKQTGQWGTVYNQDQDLGRTPMEQNALAAPQEIMTISFENTHGKTTQLHIKWEKTDEFVTVTAR